jgi:very-short-patch-repair endonuclease
MPVKNFVRGQRVSYEMHERAKKLRHELTPAEKILWEKLRANRLNGLHFRRQQIVYGYFADFYCHQHALIVEMDGGIHFKNEEVFKNLSVVLEKIVEACSLTDSPFPIGKGAGGIGQEKRDD